MAGKFSYGTSSYTQPYTIDFINPDCHLLGKKYVQVCLDYDVTPVHANLLHRSGKSASFREPTDLRAPAPVRDRKKDLINRGAHHRKPSRKRNVWIVWIAGQNVKI